MSTDSRAVAVYVRVSTTRQDLRAQEPELKSWAEVNAGDRRVVWYRDQHTGRSMDRPALNRLERDIQEDKVGAVVVWRNDRMGRRARQLLTSSPSLKISTSDVSSTSRCATVV